MANHGDPNRRTFRTREAPVTRADYPTIGDLVGKLDRLVIDCPKCGRKGDYSVIRLVHRYGPDMPLTEWGDAVTADCPRRTPEHLRDYARTDPCGARCLDLPRVL